MCRTSKGLVLASLLLGIVMVPAHAAEREDVRKVINLVSSVKMPYPENLPRSRAKTERVWLERGGTTTGCIRLEDRRWCYEHIPPDGNRAEMLRIRNEPSRGVFVGALFYYIVDFDLEGLVDVGSTTRIDSLESRESRRPTPIANVIQFFHRSTKRGERSVDEYQKMYDEGIQIALKYFGE
jgi:RNA polymerase-interacting CarD/CdnL/TRCF family regulator